MSKASYPHVTLQLALGPDPIVGLSKPDLLQGIDETGPLALPGVARA